MISQALTWERVGSGSQHLIREFSGGKIKTPSGDLIKARVAYPEGNGTAPVVIALHGMPGWKLWIEMLADQLAACIWGRAGLTGTK